MKLLVVATKPPWPPLDGGRLLLAHTLEGLAAAGLRPTLVVPFDPGRFEARTVAEALAPWCEPCLVPARPAGPLVALARSRRQGTPYSAARHTLAAVRDEVARRLGGERFDVVHAEQIQALPQVPEGSPPLVLRAQNVESDLWGATSRRRGGWQGWQRTLLAAEARRLAVWEGAAVRRAAVTLALTTRDAGRLAGLAGGGGDVRTLAAPFPAALPAGAVRLFGDPPVVVLGSRGWWPNEEGAAWFRAEAWPAVRAALPGAVLHLFGMAGRGTEEGVVLHPAPAASADAFPARSILAVPLRIASGVRMKVLEAWARGVPVVGTPEAVAGLEARHGRELLVGQDAGELAAAIVRLHREPGLARTLVAEGRRALAERHDPARLTRELLAVYGEVAAGSA